MTWRAGQTLYYLLQHAANMLPAKGKALSWRGALARPWLAGCGSNPKICSQVNIYNLDRLTLGDNVYIGFNSYIGGGAVHLDDGVVIGPFCSIVAGNHTMRDGSYRFGPYDFGEIYIGPGTWLGANVVITSNVRIGRGCLVAAGSVVTKDVPDFSVVGGVPARILRENVTS